MCGTNTILTPLRQRQLVWVNPLMASRYAEAAPALPTPDTPPPGPRPLRRGPDAAHSVSLRHIGRVMCPDIGTNAASANCVFPLPSKLLGSPAFPVASKSPEPAETSPHTHSHNQSVVLQRYGPLVGRAPRVRICFGMAGPTWASKPSRGSTLAVIGKGVCGFRGISQPKRFGAYTGTVERRRGKYGKRKRVTEVTDAKLQAEVLDSDKPLWLISGRHGAPLAAPSPHMLAPWLTRRG